MVWKLEKSLCGLKQCERNWHNLLQDFLLETGFTTSNVDPCVFVRKNEAGLIIMDDIKKVLKGRFNMKDLGLISFFLGIQFIRKENKIVMNQSCYLRNVLRRFDMEFCKPRSTSCVINPSSYDTGECIDGTKYCEVVGSLVYAMVHGKCTRPDLCFAVTKLSQHLACPNKGDWVMLTHVFRYVEGTLHYRLSNNVIKS